MPKMLSDRSNTVPGNVLVLVCPSNPPPSQVMASSQSANDLAQMAFPTGLPGVTVSVQLAGDLAFATSLPKVAASEQVGAPLCHPGQLLIMFLICLGHIASVWGCAE